MKHAGAQTTDKMCRDLIICYCEDTNLQTQTVIQLFFSFLYIYIKFGVVLCSGGGGTKDKYL